MMIQKMEKPRIEPSEKRKAFLSTIEEDDEPIKLDWMFINVRILMSMVNKIDAIVRNKRIGMSRTGWILEAIQNHIQREEKGE